jgi:hypothetical protein
MARVAQASVPPAQRMISKIGGRQPLRSANRSSDTAASRRSASAAQDNGADGPAAEELDQDGNRGNNPHGKERPSGGPPPGIHKAIAQQQPYARAQSGAGSRDDRQFGN